MNNKNRIAVMPKTLETLLPNEQTHWILRVTCELRSYQEPFRLAVRRLNRETDVDEKKFRRKFENPNSTRRALGNVVFGYLHASDVQGQDGGGASRAGQVLQ